MFFYTTNKQQCGRVALKLVSVNKYVLYLIGCCFILIYNNFAANSWLFESNNFAYFFMCDMVMVERNNPNFEHIMSEIRKGVYVNM